MTQDPSALAKLFPQAFAEAKEQVTEDFKATQKLLDVDFGDEEKLWVLFGPLPQPFPHRIAFQVVWFGGEDSPWPDNEITPPARLRAETKGVGKICLWAFQEFAEASELVANRWAISLAPPDMQ